MEQEQAQIINSVILSNTAAVNADASGIAIGISNNEISNLSHALICLNDEDFERYVLALRTLRSVSKAFDTVSKNFAPGYVRSENKVDTDNIPFKENEDPYIERKTRQRFKRLERIDKNTKISYQYRKHFEDFFNKNNNIPVHWKDVANYCFENIYGDESQFEKDQITRFYRNFNNCPYFGPIKKVNGYWCLSK